MDRSVIRPRAFSCVNDPRIIRVDPTPVAERAIDLDIFAGARARSFPRARAARRFQRAHLAGGFPPAKVRLQLLPANLRARLPVHQSSRALAACERSTNTARDDFPLDCPPRCARPVARTRASMRPRLRSALRSCPRTDRLSTPSSIPPSTQSPAQRRSRTPSRVRFFPPSTLVRDGGLPPSRIRMFARSFSARRSLRTNPRPVARAKIDPSRTSLGCPAKRPHSTPIRLPASKSTRTAPRSFSGFRRFPVHRALLDRRPVRLPARCADPRSMNVVVAHRRKRSHPPITWSPRPPMSPPSTSSGYPADQPSGPTLVQFPEPESVGPKGPKIVPASGTNYLQPITAEFLPRRPPTHRAVARATSQTTNSKTSFPVRESAAIEPAPKFPPRRAIWNQSHRVAPKGPIWDRIFAELPREKFDRNWLKRKVTQVSEPISSRFASRPVSRARNPSLRDPLAIRFPGRDGSGFSVVARSPEQRADRVASSQVAQR